MTELPKNRAAARPSRLDILWFNLLFEKHWPERKHPKALGYFFQTQSFDLIFVLKRVVVIVF